MKLLHDEAGCLVGACGLRNKGNDCQLISPWRAASPGNQTYSCACVLRVKKGVSCLQVAKELPELAHQPLRLFWKTVTSTTNAKYEPLLERLDAGAKAAAAPLFEVYDVRTLTEQLKRQSLRLLHDGTHFLCVAYEQINDLLLNTLCDSDLSFHSG